MQLNDRIKIKAKLLASQTTSKRTPSKALAARIPKPTERAKLMSELGYYSPRACNQQNPSTGNRKKNYQPGAQLATFSSKELLDSLRTLPKDSHDALLRKELAKFRAEIEAKHKSSQINKIYHFPRPLSGSTDSDDDIDSRPDNPATTKDPSDSHTTIDRRPETPKTSNIKLRAAHRKVLTHISPESFKRTIPETTVDRKCTPKKKTNKKNKWPFLMLSIRKPPEKKVNEPRYKTVDKKSDNIKDTPIDFKKDLQEYIDKKEQQSKPVVLKINSFNKMVTLTKDITGPLSPREEKFLFSSRDAIPLTKTKKMGRDTNSQRANYATSKLGNSKKDKAEAVNEQKIISLEKLLERLKEKQSGLNAFQVTFDPGKAIKKDSQSRLRQSTASMNSNSNKKGVLRLVGSPLATTRTLCYNPGSIGTMSKKGPF